MTLSRPEARPIAVTNAALRIGIKVMPMIPDWLKWRLAGGRRVCVDGNTLDATIQLILAAQRPTNTGGLGAADDPAYARALMRNSHVAMATHIDVPTIDLTIPGPDGLLPTRHCRPTVAEAPPLLLFFHGVVLSSATSNPTTVCAGLFAETPAPRPRRPPSRRSGTTSKRRNRAKDTDISNSKGRNDTSASARNCSDAAPRGRQPHDVPGLQRRPQCAIRSDRPRVRIAAGRQVDHRDLAVLWSTSRAVRLQRWPPPRPASHDAAGAPKLARRAVRGEACRCCPRSPGHPCATSDAG